jgi:hypothetical protein
MCINVRIFVREDRQLADGFNIHIFITMANLFSFFPPLRAESTELNIPKTALSIPIIDCPLGERSLVTVNCDRILMPTSSNLQGLSLCRKEKIRPDHSIPKTPFT